MKNNTPSVEKIQLPSDQNSSGRTLGAEEIALVTQAIESGTLTSTKGTFVKEVESRFADMFDSNTPGVRQVELPHFIRHTPLSIRNQAMSTSPLQLPTWGL